MGRKSRSTSANDEAPGSGKKARTGPQQQGIAAALAAQGQRATTATDLVVEQQRERHLLDRRLTEELTNKGEQYLQCWGDKCYGMRDDAARKGGRAAHHRATESSSYSKQDNDLDAAAMRYIELFRHLQQQAFREGAAFNSWQLEVLVLLLRSDVVHALGAVSHQAYSLLTAYLQRYPYATLGYHEGGEFSGRPYLILDEQAAWQPLAAAGNFRGLSKKYIFEEAIKDAGFNYHLDHSASSVLAGTRKKGGQLKNVFELMALCFDRAVDSVDEDHNGDVLLLRYLLRLLQQDLQARVEVFRAYADVESAAQQRKRAAVLQHSLLWRIWADMEVDDNARKELLRLVLRLIVGVASEQDLQEVDAEHLQLDKEAELASPCVCTPRELAALAACFLNMLLDMCGVAEAAGGFQPTAPHRMHRHNLRLRLDRELRDLFWKNASDAVCKTDDQTRTFLTALAPAHRLRLLSLVAMGRVSKAYTVEEAARRPPLSRAKRLDSMVDNKDSCDFPAAFPADPVVAMQCLNFDKGRSIKVFALANGDSAANNLAVVACGIALAAHSLAACGAEVPTGSGEDGEAGSGSSGGSSGGPGGVQQLRQELGEFLGFLADKYREARASDKKEWALYMSRNTLMELVHAQAALAALA